MKGGMGHESPRAQSAQNPASVVGGDEIARDEQGRFAPK